MEIRNGTNYPITVQLVPEIGTERLVIDTVTIEANGGKGIFVPRDGCRGTGLVAYNVDDREIAILNQPPCQGDVWIVDDDEPSRLQGATRTPLRQALRSLALYVLIAGGFYALFGKPPRVRRLGIAVVIALVAGVVAGTLSYLLGGISIILGLLAALALQYAVGRFLHGEDKAKPGPPR